MADLHPEVEKEIEAGPQPFPPPYIGSEPVETPEAFATRIALIEQEAEREACVKVCRQRAEDHWDTEAGALGCAEAIEARGRKA